MFGETTVSYIEIWNHPIETTIYKWLFGVPGVVYDFQHVAFHDVSSSSPNAPGVPKPAVVAWHPSYLGSWLPKFAESGMGMSSAFKIRRSYQQNPPIASKSIQIFESHSS